jgi:hypothetical protein
MSRVVEPEEIFLPVSWREQAEHRLVIGGVAVLFATLFVLAVQLIH